MHRAWLDVVREQRTCVRCRDAGLLHPEAKPLFCRFLGQSADVLFVAEAPNFDDTHDPGKGYLTIDPKTDPSGAFFYELYTHVLGEPLEQLAVTNAVLYLPAGSGGVFPVTSKIMRACSRNLRDQVLGLDPLVVVPLGGKALAATDLIERHGLKTMREAVASARPWFGRTLFPAFHTGLLARNGPTGRRAEQQREDWAKLRDVLRNARRSREP